MRPDGCCQCLVNRGLVAQQQEQEHVGRRQQRLPRAHGSGRVLLRTSRCEAEPGQLQRDGICVPDLVDDGGRRLDRSLAQFQSLHTTLHGHWTASLANGVVGEGLWLRRWQRRCSMAMAMPDGKELTESGVGPHLPDRIPVNLKALDRERLMRGWSKVELAKRMGIGPNMVFLAYSRASRSPSFWPKLAATLAAHPAPEAPP